MEILKSLLLKNQKRIVFLIADGLGGVPHPEHENKTELEAARTPNLDKLAERSSLGLTIPIDYGITPGSGPAHLALFGYDPIKHEIGRGALEAYGIGLELGPDDVAARGNFATFDSEGKVIDRRAGRISTEECKRLVDKISKNLKPVEEGVEIILKPAKEHRFVVIFRGPGLGDKLPDTDPQKEGKFPIEPQGQDFASKRTARLVKKFSEMVREILKDEPKANGILLRGFARKPDIEPFSEKFGLKPLAIAAYPMYKGITRLLSMETPLELKTFEEEMEFFKNNYRNYDFIYIHYKDTDKAGEDGDFDLKVQKIEKLDSFIPEILATDPDVLVVTGDHSTPSLLKSHSWHPNPLLLYSKSSGGDGIREFSEKACLKGSLGIIKAINLMPLALANAGKLKKFGA